MEESPAVVPLERSETPMIDMTGRPLLVPSVDKSVFSLASILKRIVIAHFILAMLSSVVSFNVVDYSAAASFFGYYGADLYKRDPLFVYFLLAFLFSITDILRIALNITDIQNGGLTASSMSFLFILFCLFIIKVLAVVVGVQLHVRLRDYRPSRREAFPSDDV